MTASRSIPDDAAVDPKDRRLHLGGPGADLGDARRGHRARRPPAPAAGADHRLHPPQHAARLRGPAVPRGASARGAGLRLPAVSDRGPLSRRAAARADPVLASCRRSWRRTWASGPGSRSRASARGSTCGWRCSSIRCGSARRTELVWYVAEQDAPAAGPAGGLLGGPRPADRRDAAVGDARPARRERATANGHGADGRAAACRRAWPSCSIGSASRRSRAGATRTGSGSRSRRCGGSAATGCATCRRSRPPPRRRVAAPRPAAGGHRARTPTPRCTAC